jgi:hypothetical protein
MIQPPLLGAVNAADKVSAQTLTCRAPAYRAISPVSERRSYRNPSASPTEADLIGTLRTI